MLPQDPNSPPTGPPPPGQSIPAAGLGPIQAGAIPTSPPAQSPVGLTQTTVFGEGSVDGGDDDKHKGREGLIIGAGVLLGALMVLGGLFGFQRWRSSSDQLASSVQTESSEVDQADPATDDESGSAGATADEGDQSKSDRSSEGDLGEGDDTAPGQSPDTEDNTEENSEENTEGNTDSETDGVVPSECPTGTMPEICTSVRFVEEETGRAFKEFPDVELLADEQFDAELLKDFEQYEPDFDEDEIVLKATGLLDSNVSLYDTYLSLLELGVVGFYDPETGQLVVRGGELDLYAQSVLVHELAHAHDDQWYDLDRDDFANDDAEYGFSALVEGNASRVENAWIASLSSAEAAQVQAGAFAALAPQDFAKLLALPPILVQLQSSPYEDGEIFVASRTDAAGEDAIADLYANPPQSSEQVLHPADEYQPILTVDPPPADGPVTSTGSIGELLLSFWLGDQAAVGWGGDTFVTWSDGSTKCMVVDIAADTEQDLSQIEAAATRWATIAGVGQRSAEVVDTAERSVVRITGCYND